MHSGPGPKKFQIQQMFTEPVQSLKPFLINTLTHFAQEGRGEASRLALTPQLSPFPCVTQDKNKVIHSLSFLPNQNAARVLPGRLRSVGKALGANLRHNFKNFVHLGNFKN